MKRLTERFSNGEVGVLGCGDNCKYEFKHCENRAENCPAFLDIYKKLADYEDAEEQGLLLRLPCKVGTTVYVIEEEWEEIYEPSSKYYFVRPEKFDVSMLEIFGKDVFLTKEEAEQALKHTENAR